MMNRFLYTTAVCLLLFTAGWMGLHTAVAQEQDTDDEPHRAGLVVEYGDGQTDTACVTFEADTINGRELLEQSGLLPAVGASGGLGAAVCRIGQTGCPGDDCFCECKGGGECRYWSYWRLRDGEWTYSQAGAGNRTIRPGDVDGWVWGAGNVNEAPMPMSTSFDQICAADTAAAAPAPPSPTEETIDAPDWMSYGVFAGLLLALGGALLVVRRRT